MSSDNPSIVNKTDYIDHQRHAEQIANYIELTKKGAVIGITGVRGAGKSALMDELCQRIEANKSNNYYVCKMTAPASYEEPMAFLRTVCLNLCNKVMTEARDVLYRDKNKYEVEEKKVKRKLWWLSFDRLLGLFSLAIVIFLWSLFYVFDNPLFAAYEVKSYDNNSVQIDVANVEQADTLTRLALVNQPQLIKRVKTAEQNTIGDLVQQIDHLLLLTSDNSGQAMSKLAENTLNGSQKYRLTWGSDGVGFSLLAVKANKPANMPMLNVEFYRMTVEQLRLKLAQALNTVPIELPKDKSQQADYLNTLLEVKNLELTTKDSPVFASNLSPYVRYVLQDGVGPQFAQDGVFDDNKLTDDSERPIDLLTLLYSRATVMSFERHLLRGQHGEASQAQLVPLAQRLRSLLQSGLVVDSLITAEIYLETDDDGRPAHILPSWLISETLVQGKVTLTTTQLVQLKQLLLQYSLYIKPHYRPADWDNLLLSLLLLSSLLSLSLSSLSSLSLSLSSFAIYLVVGFTAVAVAVVAVAVLAGVDVVDLVAGVDVVDVVVVVDVVDVVVGVVGVVGVVAVVGVVGVVAVAVIVYTRILRQLSIEENREIKERLLTLLTMSKTYSKAKTQIKVTKQFQDELNYHTDIQASGEISHGWFKVGQQHSKQQRTLNLPLLTTKFGDYCKQLLNAGGDDCKVIMAIDELDKIHDIAQVKQLLSDIKGALHLPNCYFILTIAEDCAESFQQRLAKGRDIFESSFDEMFYVERVERKVTNRLGSLILRSHNKNKNKKATWHEPDDSFYHLIFLFSGGVAREVNRNLKLLYCDQEDPAMLSDIALIGKLLAKSWSEWQREMLSLPINHVYVDLLHQKAKAALEQLRFGVNNERLTNIKLLVTESIAVFDQKTLEQIIWNDKQTHANEEEKQQHLALVEQFAGIRSLIKLEILTCLSIGWLSDDDWTEAYDHIVIESFRLLEKQPILARGLIERLREKQVVSAGVD